MKNTIKYETPVIEIIDMTAEGVFTDIIQSSYGIGDTTIESETW